MGEMPKVADAAVAETAIRALVDSWRERAQRNQSYRPSMKASAVNLAIRQCADELAALLAHPPEERQEDTRVDEPATSTQQATASENEAIRTLREAIYWALGERDEFGEEPAPLAGKYRRRFWWRAELRKRAGAALPPAPTKTPS